MLLKHPKGVNICGLSKLGYLNLAFMAEKGQHLILSLYD